MRVPLHFTIVIKLGTSSIVDEKTHQPLISILSLIVETAVRLRKNGHRVIIVSSGAIGVGLQRMNIEKKPKQLAKKQVCYIKCLAEARKKQLLVHSIPLLTWTINRRWQQLASLDSLDYGINCSNLLDSQSHRYC